jgi:hypothetical protein
MCTKLPRELRDAIYEYACTEGGPTLYTKHWEAPRVLHKGKPKPSLLRFDSLGTLIDTRYMCGGASSTEELHTIINRRLDPYRQSIDGSELKSYCAGFSGLDLNHAAFFWADIYEAEDERINVHDRCVLQPKYVGAHIAKEAAEVYYSKNHFVLAFDETLPDFLSLDVFGVRVQPYEHMRVLLVSIRCELMTRFFNRYESGEAEAYF